jgi:p-methyltransferase
MHITDQTGITRTLRAAVIGHVVVDSQTVKLSAHRATARNQVSVNAFLKVLDTDGKTMIEDLAYFSKTRKNGAERFSVWDMYLTSGLLLTSLLRRAGADTHLINAIEPETEEGLWTSLTDFNPDLVVLSTTFILSRAHFMRAAEKVRAAAPNAFIVAGGQHVYTTLLYMDKAARSEYLSASGIDGFINDSQGEGALIELVGALSHGSDIGDVANLIWRNKQGEIVHNRAKPENNDINSTLIDFDLVKPGSLAHMRTARSCSFKCAFCSYPTIAGDLSLMDMDNVRRTLKDALANDVRGMVFSDDTFNVPKERFEQILDIMIDIGWDRPWYSFLRCQYLDQDLVKKMKAAHCDGVFLGIESGSDEILKNMKKGAIIKFYRRGIAWLKAAGITTVGAFVVGFPGETEETVEMTRAFIEESGLDYYFIQPFFYLHHAPIHKRADHFGLKGNGLFWSHKTMNWKAAVAHVHRLFSQIEGATFINPDNNLWEFIYLRGKGLSHSEFRDYRRMINKMIAKQVVEYGLNEPPKTSTQSAGVTSRDAVEFVA